MKIKHTVHFTIEELQAVQKLYEICRQEEALTISFPCEEFTSSYLLYDEENDSLPAAVLGLIYDSSSDDSAECFALTHPKKRQKGYFSALLDAAEEEIEEYDLLFLTDGCSPGATHTLRALEAEPLSTEYRMEYDLTQKGEYPHTSRLTVTESTEEDESIRYDFSLTETQTPVACCRTRRFGIKSCFYDFLVQEEFRGRGLGAEALLLVLQRLSQKQETSVFLHVSGENLPAVSLYQKTGFRICETLSVFLY